MASDLQVILVAVAATFALLHYFAPTLSDVQQAVVAAVVGGGAVAINVIWTIKKRPPVADSLNNAALNPRVFTVDELAWYDGVKNSAAARKTSTRSATEHPLPEYDDMIFVGVKGVVYSVSAEWYGTDSPYHAFTGRDSSRHLGKVVVGNTEANCDWSTMDKAHLKALDEWDAKFKSKYPVVGTVKFGADFHTKAAAFEP